MSQIAPANEVRTLEASNHVSLVAEPCAASAAFARQTPAGRPGKGAMRVLGGSSSTGLSGAGTPAQTEKEDGIAMENVQGQNQSAQVTLPDAPEDESQNQAQGKTTSTADSNNSTDEYEVGMILEYMVEPKRKRDKKRQTKKPRKAEKRTAYDVQVMETRGKGDEREVQVWYLVEDPEHPKDKTKRRPMEKEKKRGGKGWESPGWVKVTSPDLQRRKEDVVREKREKRKRQQKEKAEAEDKKKRQRKADKDAAAAAKAGPPVQDLVDSIRTAEDLNLARMLALSRASTPCPEGPCRRGKAKPQGPPEDALEAAQNARKQSEKLMHKAAKASKLINPEGKLSREGPANVLVVMSVEVNPPTKAGMPGRRKLDEVQNPTLTNQTKVTGFVSADSPLTLEELGSLLQNLGGADSSTLTQNEQEVKQHYLGQRASRGFETHAFREVLDRSALLTLSPKRSPLPGPAMSVTPSP